MILITDLDIPVHHDIIVKGMIRTLFYSQGILNNSVVITPETIVMITLGTDQLHIFDETSKTEVHCHVHKSNEYDAGHRLLP